MKKFETQALVALVIFGILANGCSKKPLSEGIQTIAEFEQLFANPPSEYRSAPLWDWNEQISEQGIDFQMKEFKKAGIGGVFVHPRPGLLTEYLSDDWFHLFDYTVQKGKELDMNVWIYDENSYPSGFAGGHVPAEMPDSYIHGTALELEVQPKLNILFSDTIEVVLKETADGFQNITGSLNEENGKAGTYYIFRKTYPSKSPWYGGFTYVDLLYNGVTEKFIDVTMTKGYEKNLADFGNTLPGIFTDEPNLEAAMTGKTRIRWTPGIWDDFQQRWGYDLRTNLPSLVDETGNWKKVRHDYYELLLELFVDRWAKPWSKYCDEKGLKWTGHYWEHGWPEPTDGSDESAFYIWHQMPGVDMLGNRLDTLGFGGQFGNDRAVRELRSAANQAGRTRTLSETYGGGGWEMSFEEQKRLVDWEVVLGVNFVNQHLSYYSLNGVRKFDYPPSFSYHEPWWKHYHLMGDYIGRICMAMSSGDQINHTLVLQPNTTAWMYFSRKVRNPEMDKIKNGFKNFVYQLEQMQYEFDLGSENVLKTIGNVNGKMLQVGKRDYSLVVIPAEMENMDQPTFELIKKYVKNGGKLLLLRTDVPLIDGESSSKMKEWIATSSENVVVADNLDDEAAKNLLYSNEFSMDDKTKNGMLYHQRRILDDGQILFVVNSHPKRKASAEVSVDGNYVSKHDLIDGTIYSYPAKAENGKITFQVDLEPAGSAMFSVTNKKTAESELKTSSGAEVAVKSSDPLRVKRDADNVMMINYLDIKTAKSNQNDVYFMDALIGLFKENGIEMGNPWQHKIQYKKTWLELDTIFDDNSWFEANYHFTINPNLDVEKMKGIRVVVERPELWSVYINNQPVEKIQGKHWIDRDFPEYAVGEFLKPGTNTLTLKAPRMNILAEVMPVYLLGDFLVQPAKQGFEIAGGEINSLGSWRENGWPFYSQTVSYSQSFMVSKKEQVAYKIKLAGLNAPLCEVLVNGESAGLIAWQPLELDVSDKLKDGENEISLRFFGSLKNTFGFFYQPNDNWIFGPFSWNYAPEKIPAASEYHFMDYGLFEPFQLVEIR